VFLDRDGTIIEDRGYIARVEDIVLFPWSARAIAELKAAGFLVIVVTNQAGVARGIFEEAFVATAHEYLSGLLQREGAAVDAYYYCPHHLDGVVERYRVACACRKPEPGMIQAAARALDVDVTASFVIGDKWLDVELAHRAGATGVLVRTGYGRSIERARPPHVVPAAIVDTLADAASWILERTRIASSR
jgi:D-glycero-D-manno-heptose 1,7-bisphosphate phosphatase